MERKTIPKYDVMCVCGGKLSYDPSYRYNHKSNGCTTLYFDCHECNGRFSIKYNADCVEVDRKCIGKAKARRDGRSFVPKPSTLCWDCQNARGNGCSWFRNFTPVPGWVAEKGDLYGVDDSYTVKECPEFVRDDR